MSAAHSDLDTAVAHASQIGAAPHPILVLTTTILVSSLAFIDGSVVNVGLPAIGHSLNADTSALQWIITGYLLPLSALLLLGGAAGDRFGRRAVLVVGTGLFAIASALCALAPSAELLILARVGQGVGAALLMPNSLAILGGAFAGAARGRAIGVWASAGAIAGAIGPVLGGFLIDHMGWRAIFLINLPIAIVAIGLALGFVRDTVEPSGAPLDVAGAALATIGLSGLTWGLIVISAPAPNHAVALVTIGLGLISLIVFILVEARRGDDAMTPLTLFASREFVGLTLLTVLLYGALGTFLILAPFVLIKSAGYDGTAAGAALLPFPLIIAATAPLMGGLVNRLGSRILLTAGPLVAAAGYLLLLRVPTQASYWRDLLPAIVVVAIGMSGAVAPLTTAVLASVDARHTGVASGVNSAVARTGGLFGAALLGGVLSMRGPGLVGGLHAAAWACAAAAFLSGLFALILLGPNRSRSASVQLR